MLYSESPCDPAHLIFACSFTFMLQYDSVFEDVIYDVLLLKFEPEKGQQVLLDIPFVSVNAEKSPGFHVSMVAWWSDSF